MLLMRESIWWLLATGAIGYFCGWLKGRPIWGMLAGLLLGPVGIAAMLLFPPPSRARWGTRPAPGAAAGPACPRCGKGVGRAEKACAHCGNLLVPIRYKVSVLD